MEENRTYVILTEKQFNLCNDCIKKLENLFSILVASTSFPSFLRMAKPTFEITDTHAPDGQAFRLVKFEIPGGVTTPAQFVEAVSEIEASLQGKLPILINGRGPVWGYGMLFHTAHPSPAIATYDPRLGYVVIQTHDERFHLGQVIELNDVP